MTHLKTAIFLVALGLFSGCGYQFQGSGSILPDDVKTVAIPIAENSTTEPGLGLRFTEALRSRFDRYGAVSVIEDSADADAVLRAKILGIDYRVRNVTSTTDIELEQELVMIIGAELRHKTGQLLWRNERLQVIESFASTSDVVVTSSAEFSSGNIGSGSLGSLGSREVSRGQQDEALEEVLEEASRKIYLQAVAADF